MLESWKYNEVLKLFLLNSPILFNGTLQAFLTLSVRKVKMLQKKTILLPVWSTQREEDSAFPHQRTVQLA